MIIISIWAYQEELVRLCKPCHEVFRRSTKGRERKRSGQIMEEQTWENGGEGGIKGVRQM